MSGPSVRPDPDRAFALALARAFGGALFFALPLFLTMEMWWLGFYMDRLRLAVLMTLTIPLLMALSRSFGFDPSRSWAGMFRQAMVGYAVGLVTAAAILWLIGILRGFHLAHEFIGKLAVQAVPASIGAIVGAGQFAPAEAGEQRDRRTEAGYGTELYFMFAGAVYLGIAVAPTEEMIVIAYKMTDWHALALTAASIAIFHALVYAIDFRRRHVIPRGTPGWNYFLRFTVVGYAIALVVSVYILWTFGRVDNTDLGAITVAAMVLGFPVSLGAAAARLIL